MKISILGCGPSGGVPMIGLGWGACDPTNPKNRRRRSSILVQTNGKTILIDCSPDCREQLIDANISHIDAIFFTHDHADHCHGIDDLRWVCHAMGGPIPVFGEKSTLARIAKRFDYAFDGLDERAGRYYYKPVLLPHVIEGSFIFDDIKVHSFQQDHGHGNSLGFRIGAFAYSTDVWNLDDTAFAHLAGVELWLVDALQLKPHPTHSHLARTLEWIKKVQPEQAFLTHMNCHMDYAQLLNALPDNVRPAYDGLVLEI